SGENWLYQLLPTPTGTPYGYGVGTVAPSGWLWQSLGASAPVLPYRVAEIKKIATIGVISWIHPTVQWIQVEVQSSAGAVMKGYLNLTDPADGSTVLDVAGSCTSGSSNVPTPEVTMPVAPTSTSGIVMPTMYSIFGGLNNVGTGTPSPAPKIAPAVMGSCFMHDGSTGGTPCAPNTGFSTIDLVPRNVELCLDAKVNGSLGQCDPDATLVPNGIPLYSPVSGCMFYTAGNHLVIEFSPTGDSYLDNCQSSLISHSGDRFQVTFTHLKSTYTTQAWQSVQAGQLIGFFCNKNEWTNSHTLCRGPVSLDPTAPQHLAVHLFKSKTGYISDPLLELPNDVRAFFSRPHCMFDVWKYTHGASTPSLQTPPSNQNLSACP
ncbi:MAG: hypothetical protein KF726_23530, partial [Anaerolineae bacterium]|nr:hypothetical protein [Anaerolineae bacterium]